MSFVCPPHPRITSRAHGVHTRQIGGAVHGGGLASSAAARCGSGAPRRYHVPTPDAFITSNDLSSRAGCCCWCSCSQSSPPSHASHHPQASRWSGASHRCPGVSARLVCACGGGAQGPRRHDPYSARANATEIEGPQVPIRRRDHQRVARLIPLARVDAVANRELILERVVHQHLAGTRPTRHRALA